MFGESPDASIHSLLGVEEVEQGLAGFRPIVIRNMRTTDIAARVAKAKADWGSEVKRGNRHARPQLQSPKRLSGATRRRNDARQQRQNLFPVRFPPPGA